jgi:hypothetical protein
VEALLQEHGELKEQGFLEQTSRTSATTRTRKAALYRAWRRLDTSASSLAARRQ